MYSLVLIAALTTGQQSPGFFHNGGHGGAGYAGYTGCYGDNPYCRYGSGYTAWGYGNFGCHGCYGCGGCNGCGGGWNNCYGCGGYSNLDFLPCPPGMYSAIAKPTTPELSVTKKKGAKQEKEDTSATNQGRIIIAAPTGARIYIDDRPVSNASTSQRFLTPPLQPGVAYYYEVRAEVTVDGERFHEARRVVVRAGQVAREDFRTLGTVPSTAKARPTWPVRPTRAATAAR